MIKKLLLSFILCLNLLLPAYSVEDDSIIAPVAIFVERGMITTPKLYDAFNYKSAFVQWDAKEKNKLAVFVYLGTFSDTIAHYNEDATDKKYDYRYDSGYVRQYILEHDIPVALYKLAGDTIYQYDNNPDLKKGFLGFLGFCEDGPGHLISTTKILDDGSLVKFDSSGNKKIGMFRLLTEDDVTLKPSFSEPVSDESFGIIIPIIVALANNNCFDDTTFSARVKNATSVSHYDSYGNSDGRFTISGNRLTQYNDSDNIVASFHISGNSVSHYNAKGKYIGSFRISDDSVSHYNAAGYSIETFSLLKNKISKRNAQGYSTESFSIFGDSVFHYNSSGYSVGSFSFF